MSRNGTNVEHSITTKLCGKFPYVHMYGYICSEDCVFNTVVACIYAPRFATLSASRKRREGGGGAYIRDLTFDLANTPPLRRPRLDVDTGTL